MKHKAKILAELISKHQGVQKEILNRVADHLANTVSEESEIETAVENADGLVRSFSTFFQSETDRRVTEAVKKREAELAKEKEKGDQGAGNPNPEPKPTEDPKDDTPAWAKSLVQGNQELLKQNQALTERITALEGGKVADTRMKSLEELLKDADETLRSDIINDALKMPFESDDDFNAWAEKKSELVKAINQKKADEGLGQTSRPIVAAGGAAGKEASTKELDEVMSNFKI